MAHHIKNQSSIPFEVPTLNGPVHLPAHGEVTVNLGALDAMAIEHSPYVTIEHVADAPAAEGGPVDLRTQYEALFGEPPDGRWSDKRIQDAINKAAG